MTLAGLTSKLARRVYHHNIDKAVTFMMTLDSVTIP